MFLLKSPDQLRIFLRASQKSIENFSMKFFGSFKIFLSSNFGKKHMHFMICVIMYAPSLP